MVQSRRVGWRWMEISLIIQNSNFLIFMKLRSRTPCLLSACTIIYILFISHCQSGRARLLPPAKQQAERQQSVLCSASLPLSVTETAHLLSLLRDLLAWLTDWLTCLTNFTTTTIIVLNDRGGPSKHGKFEIDKNQNKVQINWTSKQISKRDDDQLEWNRY